MTEFVTFLLPALPLLALLLALLLGRYPGCEAIVRLSERIAVARRRRLEGPGRRRPAHRPPSLVRAGGLLLALSLSGRAPPAAA
ncbi:MAG TPA: hypothetical protein VFY75_09040 [Solirubrobacterales bacterium]|nr:hypothetical protein [Solirubrobacterales bacterium]